MKNIFPDHGFLMAENFEQLLNQKAKVLWLTGLSGSGKSTIAKSVEQKLFALGYAAKVLDGDNIRTGISNNLGFSLRDREENIRRISEVAKLFLQTGITTICSFVSPTLNIRRKAKEIIGKENFLEIYINASLQVCEERDVKGLYQMARDGKIKDFTGISSPYEAPVNPDLTIDSESSPIEKSSLDIVNFLIKSNEL